MVAEQNSCLSEVLKVYSFFRRLLLSLSLKLLPLKNIFSANNNDDCKVIELVLVLSNSPFSPHQCIGFQTFWWLRVTESHCWWQCCKSWKVNLSLTWILLFFFFCFVLIHQNLQNRCSFSSECSVINKRNLMITSDCTNNKWSRIHLRIDFKDNL